MFKKLKKKQKLKKTKSKANTRNDRKNQLIKLVVVGNGAVANSFCKVSKVMNSQ